MAAGRKFAKIPCGLWEGQDWPGWDELDVEEQWAYKMLRTQRDVTQAGTLRLGLKRWSRTTKGMDAERLRGILLRLVFAEYIVIDWETEEVLLRYFIDTDEVYRQPNSVLAAQTAITQIRSEAIKTTLHTELSQLLRDLRPPKASLEVLDLISGIVGDLDTIANPSLAHRGPISTPSPGVRRIPGQGVRDPSSGIRLSAGVPTPQPPVEPGENGTKDGEWIPSRGEHSLTSVTVGSDVENEKLKTSNEDPFSPAAAADVPPGLAADIEAVCQHLARRIVENGSTPRKVTDRWRTEARLMLTKDGPDETGRSVESVHKAIDWSQSHHFWRGNIMSMPTLRKQFDQLRLAAIEEQDRKKAAASGGRPGGRVYAPDSGPRITESTGARGTI
jgi:hypothetical protein